jgi:prepilin-type N-terminal cleavage/methylation domain-containing protein
MRHLRHPRTAGFTLIELLVVVSIIAVLVAISAGAFFRVRAGQQGQLTGDKISQLQKVYFQQWTAVLDTAKQAPIPPVVMAYAQNDPDRAKAIWAYIHLRRDFPESFAEAQSLPPAPLPATYPPGVYLGGQLVLPRNEKIWNMVQGSAGLSADDQASVCAYAFLTALNRRGMESGIGDQMTSRVGDFTVFVDAFQKAITFRRLYSTLEMQARPYTANPLNANKDPLDPLGKLPTLFVGPTALTAAQQADLLNAIAPSMNAAVLRTQLTNRSNFIPTFISSGLNKKFDVDAAGQPNGDDIYGYRLNVEGRTGN